MPFQGHRCRKGDSDWLTQQERSEVMQYRKLVIGMTLLLAAMVFGRVRLGEATSPPSDQAIAFAQRTSDLLLATLFAALTQEFDETTPQNVEEGNVSIGLVFSDTHSNFRLVGTFDPLSRNDRPQDRFERDALRLALDGGQPRTAVDSVDGAWFYRRSVPLSVFRSECALCHTNFTGLGAGDWVGALMLKVPIQ
jgi:hypothetical protein